MAAASIVKRRIDIPPKECSPVDAGFVSFVHRTIRRTVVDGVSLANFGAAAYMHWPATSPE
jgi:hypothetical protein